MSDVLTKEQFIRVLPKKLNHAISDSVIDQINQITADPIIKESFRENILSYTNVMKDGKFKIQQYIDAVRYVSHKLFGSSNVEAYTKTFPDRYQRFLNQATSQKDIASYVASYNKTKLVNLIFEQTLVPTHILNADMYQKALNAQAELMMTSNSDKVRSDAANSLLTHLRMPEANKIELDISVKEDKSITELRNSTLELVKTQRAMIVDGTMNAREVAHSKLLIAEDDSILDAEYNDVSN